MYVCSRGRNLHQEILIKMFFSKSFSEEAVKKWKNEDVFDMRTMTETQFRSIVEMIRGMRGHLGTEIQEVVLMETRNYPSVLITQFILIHSKRRQSKQIIKNGQDIIEGQTGQQYL